jgi:hypothetical protein
VSKNAVDERLLGFIHENPEMVLRYVRSLEDFLYKVRDAVGAPQLPGLCALVSGLQQDPTVLESNGSSEDGK